MQLSGQNFKTVGQPQYSNSSFNSNPVTQPVAQPVAQQPQVAQAPQVNTVQQAALTPGVVPYQTQYPMGYYPPQNTVYPQYQPAPQQPQNVQVPATAAGVNIQIFNPSVSTPGSAPATYNVNAPSYPSNYYTNSVGNDGKLHPNNNTNINTNNNVNNSSEPQEKTKTEKRKVVELTDQYIMNLEQHLNSQEKAVRLKAAKEVYSRLEEDDSRFDDKALTALINKMLQDPSGEVRLIALSALDSRICKGDDYSVNVLQNMQNSKESNGQDAIDASNILLKMSAREVEKEFPVKEKKEQHKTAADVVDKPKKTAADAMKG